MAETVFELLFKYRPLLYERGELALSAPPLAVLAAAGALGVVAVLTYLRARGRARRRDRAALAGLRVALLALLLLLLARPVLLVSTVVPQENYLAVLVDDSRSMRIADGTAGDASRAGFVQDVFLDAGSGLRTALAERFRLRVYRFSDGVERLADGDTLRFDGTRTRIGRALEQVRDELAALPLSGLVLVTDGADGDAAALDEALLGLRAERMPVFAVGTGSGRPARDIEVTDVSAPATALSGSTVSADVTLEHAGLAGRTVPLLVERDGRIVGQREVRLGDDGATTVRVDFAADEGGAGAFRFRVPVQDGEAVDRNNERERTVRVRTDRQKVLYFEGEPRHEVAFLRRAVAADPSLQLVVLQRTDEDRYLRLGVDSAEELRGGFPRTREELFSYRALVLGSVEASHFSHDQLTMIEEFVARRGGGLLALGGRGALAEGGWGGTPVADALPVRLDGRPADSLFHAELAIHATREAASHPATRRDPDAPVLPWDDLPPLLAFNRVGEIKPGATALLEGRGPRVPDGQPVLALQRYGAGRAAVFAVQDSWLWQMHADIPLDDETHERLWRQLLRWLVADSPDRIGVETPARPVGVGETFEIRADVRDERFGGVGHAAVTARVTAPSGATRDVPLEWTVTRDGEYRGRFTPSESGAHTVVVESRYDAETVTSEPAAVRAGPSMEEYFGARMRRETLERVASETGGRFYLADEVTRLPEDIAYSARGATVVEELEVWDAPVFFALLLILLAAEWMYRRRRGLA